MEIKWFIYWKVFNWNFQLWGLIHWRISNFNNLIKTFPVALSKSHKNFIKIETFCGKENSLLNSSKLIPITWHYPQNLSASCMQTFL